MIKRKIRKVGYSKLIVLPKYWLEQHNIKKGDIVSVEMNDEGDLVIKND